MVNKEKESWELEKTKLHLVLESLISYHPSLHSPLLTLFHFSLD